MPLTGPDYIGNMDSSNPVGSDSKTIADDQMRNIQEGCRQTFPNVKGEVPGSQADLGICTGRGYSGQRALTGTPNDSIITFYNNIPPLGYASVTVAAEDMLTVTTSGGGIRAGSDNPINLFQVFPTQGFTGAPTNTVLVSGTGNPNISVPTAGATYSLTSGTASVQVGFTPRYARMVFGKMNA